METIGNFLTQPNKDFPLDCDTLDMLQAGTALVAALGNIAGDKLILTGCELTNNDTQRAAGYVFVKTRDYPHGEVLRWEGGNISGGMYVKLEDVSVNAQGFEYPKAYTRRTLAAGVGSENFKWEDFQKPKTSAELEKLIADLAKQQSDTAAKSVSEPLGIVKMWAGVKVPENYALCDGAMLKTSEYPELYKALGTAFNAGVNYNGTRYTTQSGFFRLPDLRGRFIVGYNDLDDEYKKYGNTAARRNTPSPSTKCRATPTRRTFGRRTAAHGKAAVAIPRPIQHRNMTGRHSSETRTPRAVARSMRTARRIIPLPIS